MPNRHATPPPTTDQKPRPLRPSLVLALSVAVVLGGSSRPRTTTDAFVVVFPRPPDGMTTTAPGSQRPRRLPSSSSSSLYRPPPLPLSTTGLAVLWDPRVTADEPGGGPLVDFPTPQQRVELKKEARRREARKTLATFVLPPPPALPSRVGDGDGNDGSGPQPLLLFSDDTFQDLWSALSEHELVLVKGVTPGQRKAVYPTAVRLCEEMEERLVEAEVDEEENDDEEEIDAEEEEVDDTDDPDEADDDEYDGDSPSYFSLPVLPVALLSTKGHTALIYCPTLPLDHPNKFVLRTSVGQKNVWSARIKAPRDHRGQIVKVATGTADAE